MEQTWRWYGAQDPVTLQDIKQTGAKGVVTALHHVPNGAIWHEQEIQRHKQMIENAGLLWNVVESLPVHESIKTRTGRFKIYIKNYHRSMENLAKCGIYTICYNFMPVLDWTRTDLCYTLSDGTKALRFDVNALAAFDLYLLKRPQAPLHYSKEEQKQAKIYLDQLSEAEKTKLIKTIIAGLPGAEEGYTLTQFQQALNAYAHIDATTLQKHLVWFLEEVIPTAEENNVQMCIHPDDPPHPILGLPRVVSTEEDYAHIFQQVPSPGNGMTFCTGSLSVISQNNLVQIFERFAERVYFLHLRNIQRDSEGNFYEARHLEGDVDMYDIVKSILIEEKRRHQAHDNDHQIPMRPDHGHQMLDDLYKEANPGYSAIGRLKGLAELRGLAMGISKSLEL